VPKIEISRFDYAILIGLGGANLIKSQIREISNLINRQKTDRNLDLMQNLDLWHLLVRVTYASVVSRNDVKERMKD